MCNACVVCEPVWVLRKQFDFAHTTRDIDKCYRLAYIETLHVDCDGTARSVYLLPGRDSIDQALCVQIKSEVK